MSYGIDIAKDKPGKCDGCFSDAPMLYKVTLSSDTKEKTYYLCRKCAALAKTNVDKKNSRTGMREAAESGKEAHENCCANCGRILHDTDLFCPSCGTKVLDSYCEKCGKRLRETDYFCPGCGTKSPIGTDDEELTGKPEEEPNVKPAEKEPEKEAEKAPVPETDTTGTVPEEKSVKSDERPAEKTEKAKKSENTAAAKVVQKKSVHVVERPVSRRKRRKSKAAIAFGILLLIVVVVAVSVTCILFFGKKNGADRNLGFRYYIDNLLSPESLNEKFDIEGGWIVSDASENSAVSAGSQIVFNSGECNLFNPKTHYELDGMDEVYTLTVSETFGGSKTFEVEITGKNTIKLISEDGYITLERIS